MHVIPSSSREVITPAVRLEADGLIEQVDGIYRTTIRWRAILTDVHEFHMDEHDPRVPIARALVELYGTDWTAAELTDLVEFLLALPETAEPFPDV